MLANGPELLRAARAHGTAIPAFTTYTLESTRAICDAAAEAGLPIIIQAGSSSFAGVGRALLAGAALTMASESPASVGVHLDHSTDLAEIRACIELGYSSVMIDGSHLDFEENVRVTRLVVDHAHAHATWVEGELGAIAGDENASKSAAASDLTTPEAATEFAARTGVDALAVAIGSVHGISEHPIHLDLALLQRIAQVVSIPLVLHGASGLDEHELQAAVESGIAKVNFNADLRRAYLGALHGAIDPERDDVVAVQRAAIDAMKRVVTAKLLLLAGN
jgi:fructose-bisphosphate aldolase class II/tagatose 1,6-diphosphate aldolase GatY/KbaY